MIIHLIVCKYVFCTITFKSKNYDNLINIFKYKNINQDKTEELEKIENEKRIIEEQKKREEEAYKKS